MLLDRGADVNAQGGEYGNALQGHHGEVNEKVVQMLLDRRADCVYLRSKVQSCTVGGIGKRSREISTDTTQTGAKDA
jgi:hypothetical protein